MMMMKAEGKDSCYSEMTVSASTIVLFAPPAAWGHDSETCLRFSDISRSFFQFVVARTILTNFVTLLHGSFVKVAIGYAISVIAKYNSIMCFYNTKHDSRTYGYTHTRTYMHGHNVVVIFQKAQSHISTVFG